MVRVSVELLALESVAVMVKVFKPEVKVMFEMLQELAVRVAVPEPPLSLAQVTSLRPLPPASSEAEPLKLRVLEVVE